MFCQKKRVVQFCLFFLVFSVFTNITNADDKDLKIAVVNIQKIEEKAKISQDMREKTINKEKELSSDELQKKAQKLELDYQKLQMDEKIFVQTLEASRMIVLSEVQDCIKKATNKVANDKYDMVIPTGMAIYINEDKFSNITDKVIDNMNKISKSVNYEKAYKQAKEQMDKIINSQKK